jgi:simple sugar transport system permease protein
MNQSGIPNWLNEFLRVVATLAIALIMGAIVMLVSGRDPIEAYTALFKAALVGKTAIANSLLAATPLIFSGLGATIAMRAGVFNVGVEGSLYVGAFAAAWVGFTFLNLPAYLVIPLCFLLAGIVGGIWCYIPGVLKARLEINEVVSTILMNHVATNFTSYLVNYPFLAPGLANSMSEEISEAARLPRLAPPSQLNLSFVIALAMVVFLMFLFRRMKLGYELRMVGDNPGFAKWAGIKVPLVIEKVMFISGLMGGLAGAGQVMGVNYRFTANFSPGLGFTGIAIALLSRKSPLGSLFAALLFGVLRAGSSTMELFTDVPRDLITVLESTVILFAALNITMSFLRRKRHAATS